MIELVSAERCINCDLCVQICPTNVFDVVPGDNPVIARQHDCQTCFMCEAYCPVDALYVAPFAERVINVSEHELERDALLGSYRRAIGWSPGARAAPDQSFRLLRGG
ncbi:4Fe-4S binding protein [Chitinolyticbacter meiyuanensis]|uniref:4Fe-4S binding protein n=1 Tax=Chitinolyticbacter meiyuanensis TaxID=682798 RepID=UPI0011E5D1BD|nr:4Fe-4S binding protein [Chitinolyticbacter meiyuanensis]